MHRFDAYSLGATLYMPVLHPRVADILHGRIPAPAASIVLCLEDALPRTMYRTAFAALTSS